MMRRKIHFRVQGRPSFLAGVDRKAMKEEGAYFSWGRKYFNRLG
jgi:hypothetical protein